MTIESQNDVDALRRIGTVVSTVLRDMLAAVEVGMTTAELDALGRAWRERHGARSAPELSYNFPGATCISINEEAAHGIPSQRRIEAGDVVNIDVSAEMDGYFADTGGTTVVPPSTTVKKRLIHSAHRALIEATDAARAGRPINHIGRAIERVAKGAGLRIIRNLGSHGVGRSLHEDPEHIPGFNDRSDSRLLSEGMVITIEPFLSTRSTFVDTADDGWTLLAEPGNLSAQFEHTMIITRGRPIVVTRH